MSLSPTDPTPVIEPSLRLRWLSIYHRAVYRCNRPTRENMHGRAQIERCRNSEIRTHILEGKVFETIFETNQIGGPKTRPSALHPH